MSTAADRLKQTRIEAGYGSATDAARAFGWAPSTYLGHENGSRGLQVDAAQRYARAFRVSWTWLLEGEDNEAIQPFGVPVIGTIGYSVKRPDFSAHHDLLLLPVDGYKPSDLFAVREEKPGSSEIEYSICAPWEEDFITRGDELFVLRPEGRGFMIESYSVLLPTKDVRDRVQLMPWRPYDGVGNALETSAIFDDPNVEIIGVAVAYLRDRRRRRDIEKFRNA